MTKLTIKPIYLPSLSRGMQQAKVEKTKTLKAGTYELKDGATIQVAENGSMQFYVNGHYAGYLHLYQGTNGGIRMFGSLHAGNDAVIKAEKSEDRPMQTIHITAEYKTPDE